MEFNISVAETEEENILLVSVSPVGRNEILESVDVKVNIDSWKVAHADGFSVPFDVFLGLYDPKKKQNHAADARVNLAALLASKYQISADWANAQGRRVTSELSKKVLRIKGKILLAAGTAATAPCR